MKKQEYVEIRRMDDRRHRGKKGWKRWLSIPVLLVYIFALYELCFLRGGSADTVFARAEVLSLLCVFALLHCFLNLHVLYDTIFRYRVLIAILLLIFCVANNFNNSSLGTWVNYIQPNSMDENALPVFGTPREIRSDEWAVTLPRMMSASYSNYGKTNACAMGGGQDNIAVANLYRDYSALARPCNWGYYFLDFSHGLSFQWSYLLIFGFLFAFELCYILTGQKMLSVLGACLLWFSSFNCWWSLTVPLLSLCALPVLFYYMLTAGNPLKRLMFGLLLAIGGADFIVVFYPAWQVPAGWIILTLMVFFLFEYRNWKKYSFSDWLVTAICLAFMASIVLRYLYANQSYIEAISNTVFPGKRVETGGYSLGKLLGYPVMLFAGARSGWALLTNECENATFALAFPLSYILLPLTIFLSFQGKGTALFHGRRGAAFSQDRAEFHEKISVRRRLLLFLLFPLSLLTLYTTCGLPLLVSKVTLMDHSIGKRAVDFLGALLVLVLVICLSMLRDLGGLRWYVALPLAVFTVFPALSHSRSILAAASWPVAEVAGLICALIIFLLLHACRQGIWEAFVLSSAVCLALGGLSVNPLMKGTEAVTGRPAAAEIRELTAKEPDALWISTAGSGFKANYLIALGARTLNSVNFVPNTALWARLDPEGKDEYIWNRYAHISIELKDIPSYSARLPDDPLITDTVNLTLGQEELDELGVRYVFTDAPADGAFAEKLKLIYEEDGVFIYQNTFGGSK